MKIKVTEPNCIYFENGTPVRAEVGQVLEVGALGVFAGRCIVLDSGAELVVATPEKTEPAETEEQRLRREYHELTGQHIGGNASLETVRKKHVEATEAAGGE